jgi:hypothetical protein
MLFDTAVRIHRSRLDVEIRNNIYAYCLEPDPVLLFYSVFGAQRFRGGPYSCSTPRQFLAVTQVCRQMRYEFAPLYYRKTEFLAPLDHLNKLNKTFFASATSAAPRNVELLLCRFRDYSRETPLVSIIPILRLQRSDPSFTFRFGRSAPCGCYTCSYGVHRLKYIFAHCEDWKRWLLDETTDVQLDVHGRRFHCVVKPSFALLMRKTRWKRLSTCKPLEGRRRCPRLGNLRMTWGFKGRRL